MDPGPAERVDSAEGHRYAARAPGSRQDGSARGRPAVAARPGSGRAGRPAARRPPRRLPSGAGGGRARADRRETAARRPPEGGTLGTLQAGRPARVVARSGDLVKVQVEGWIPADAVAPTDSGRDGRGDGRGGPRRARPIRRADGRVAAPGDRGQDGRRASERDAARPAISAHARSAARARIRLRDHPVGAGAEFQALPPLQELVLRVAIRAARTKFLTTPVAELVSVVSGMDAK